MISVSQLSTAVSGKSLLKGLEQCPYTKLPESARPMLKTGNLIWRDWRVLLPRLAQTGSVTPFAHINMVLLGD